ncbi:MAG: T9SS type A sorting domain-containing protein, partial [Bacteroidota bacterium]
INVNLVLPGDSSVGNDIGVQPQGSCPYMWVDLNQGVLRPCVTSLGVVEYRNYGTDTAFNATVDVTVDSNITVYNPFIAPIIAQNGNTYTFDIGDVAPLASGTFGFFDSIPCDTNMIARTLCVTAHVYPDTPCVAPGPLWDDSHVEMNAECQGGNNVCFNVSNTGSGNMSGAVAWRFFENAVQTQSGTLQLSAGADTALCFTANGNTFRLEVDQRPDHPGNSMPSATVELCGSPGDTTGLVNAFSHDDHDVFRSIHCGEVVGSYDPNSKYVYPAGVGMAEHFIDSTDVLQYMIDFQNTGTANALEVVLTDTLDPRLDINSIVPGASSHPFTFEVLPGRVLRFTFENIQLPPESQDPVGSIGFVKFAVRQMPGNQYLDRIENFADIVFDINSPIRTNTVHNTIGWPIVIANDPVEAPYAVRVYPNPATSEVYARVDGLPVGTVLDFELYDLMGRKVSANVFSADNVFRADLGNLSTGVYVYRVVREGQLVKAGKLILE